MDASETKKEDQTPAENEGEIKTSKGVGMVNVKAEYPRTCFYVLISLKQMIQYTLC